jgi:hypothetical protein
VSALVDTLVVTLLLTLPGTKAHMAWVPPDERAMPSDSLSETCLPSASPIFDLDSLLFYASPVTGGGYRRVYGKSVRGREGQLDSTRIVLPGWTAAHFYATTKRIGIAKQSCASNTTYKALPTVTGVELPAPLRLVREEWFDVHGRRLKGPTGTGIRFVRWTVKGRFIGQQRVPVVRGVPLVALRRPTP